MAFFSPQFNPFFRLLDDMQTNQPQCHGRRGGFCGPPGFAAAAASAQLFTPKFDLYEKADKYVIQGEVPGVKMEDINIEWHKDVLQISGHAEHKHQCGRRPSEESTGATAATTDTATAPQATAEDSDSINTAKGKQAAVEDATDEGGDDNLTDYAVVSPTGDTPATAPAVAAAAKSDNEEEEQDSSANKETKANDEVSAVHKRCRKHGGGRPRYWVQERSFGQFNRSFSFPTPIAHGAISATLNNGVLQVELHKVPASAPHRVQINRL